MKIRLARHPEQRYIFTQREFDALYGLGPLAFALYCTLRTLMDFESGEAGRKSGFAWNDLYTELETATPKGKGFIREKPTEQNMKTAVSRLEKAGLIERRQGQYIVFFLPMALKGDVRSKQTQRIPNGTLPTEPNDRKSSNDAGFGGVSNGGSVRWVRPNPTHIRDSGFTPSQSSSTGIDGARADDDSVHRDRPAASQAAPAGRGKHHAVDRDRPQAASHPAPGRRFEPDGATVGALDHAPSHATAVQTSAESELPADRPNLEGGRAGAIRDGLRRRGIAVPSNSDVVAAWAAEGVTDDELDEAVRRAFVRRETDESVQPVNVGYLASIVRSVRRESARAEQKRRAAESSWEVDNGALMVMAESLGMQARPGEEYRDLRLRVRVEFERRSASGG